MSREAFHVQKEKRVSTEGGVCEQGGISCTGGSEQ